MIIDCHGHYTTAPKALEQWRKLVGDDAAAMKDLRMVISGRVMRRLCNACKVAYAPDVLGQLRIDAFKTQVKG